MARLKQRIVLCGSGSAAQQILHCAEELKRLDRETVIPANIDSTGKSIGQLKLGSFLDYFEEIKTCDAVLVVNYTKGNTDGYIGPHTLIEMAYAEALKRPIYLLNSRPKGLDWCDELNALEATVLHGDLKKIPRILGNKPTPHASNISGADGESSHEFKLERLKFIHQQIDGINKASANQWKLFQAVVTSLAGASAVVVATWKSYKVGADVAVFALQILICLLVGHGVFTALTLIANLRSWFDLREEEVECFRDALKHDYRKRPSWKNWTRWSEAWMILIVIIATVALSILAFVYIVPLVKAA